MRRHLKRVFGFVGIALLTSIMNVKPAEVRNQHRLQEGQHSSKEKKVGSSDVSNFGFSAVGNPSDLDAFSEVVAFGIDDSGLTESHTLKYGVLDNQVGREANSSSSRNLVTPEVPIKALFVFTLVREDLLDLNLLSIDYPVDEVFVIRNGAKSGKSAAFQRVLDRYEGCVAGTRGRTCANLNIRSFEVLSSDDNLGYAGSFNLAIKVMLVHNLTYAIFNGDDTRFVPGRLRDAKVIVENESACMYHFEGYSSFAISLSAVTSIGPMDENFWPAYCEDCDYWYRSQLAGCRIFYRGGYVPEVPTPESKNNSFVEHGDATRDGGSGSSSFKSDPLVGKLVANTLHPSRGRFAYLKRKWGFDTCGLYHEVLNRWRDQDVVLDAMSYAELQEHGAKWALPYNDTRTDILHWIPEDPRSPGAISSRAVNSQWAPLRFVWEEQDYTKLQDM